MQKSLFDYIDVDCEMLHDICDDGIHGYMNMDYPGWPGSLHTVACEDEVEFCVPRGD